MTTTTILVQKDPKNLVPMTVTPQQRTVWAQSFTIYDLNADGTKSAPVGPTVIAGGTTMSRTAAQLGAAPSAADVAIFQGEFYLDTDPTQRYVVNASGTAYVAKASGGGSGAFSGITGQPTDNTNLATALAAKAPVNATQATQIGAGATTAVLNSAKTALKDPAGGADIAFGGGGTAATAAPLALAATAAVGTSTKFMREDAVLPLPSPNALGALPQSSGNYNAATNTVLTGPFAGQHLSSGTLPTGSGPGAFTVTVAGTPGLDSVGALSVADVLFFNSALVWDVMGGATQTTGLYKGDGTTSGRLVAAVAGLDYNPGPLFQTGVPIGVMPNCTVGAAGVITYGTTVTTAYPNGVWMWWSAAALYSGSLAGWYWTVLTGTAGAGAGGTVYNSYLPATGNASQLAGTTSGATIAGAYPIPSSPVTTGITGGTHTLTTGTVIWAPGPTSPGGYIGNNGSGEAKYLLRCNNSSTTKSFSAGGSFWQSSNPTTVTNLVNTTTFMNAGVQTRQIGEYSDIGSALDYTTAVDTTIAQVLNPKFNIAATNSGNDFLVCEFLRIMLIPRA